MVTEGAVVLFDRPDESTLLVGPFRVALDADRSDAARVVVVEGVRLARLTAVEAIWAYAEAGGCSDVCSELRIAANAFFARSIACAGPPTFR